MTQHLAFIALALVMLFVGAESLVRGSASLALRAGLSRLMVGLTIVAFGTSSPELVVSLEAALSGQGDIAVGNAIGSNSFNIGVILGVAALVCPIPVHRQIIKVDAPIALSVALLLPLFLRDQTIGRVEGTLLAAGIIAYTWLNAVRARKETETDALSGDDVTLPAVSGHWGKDIAFIVGGLGVLVLGSHLLVEHSVALASQFGASAALLGPTIVASGTSTPELATWLVAAVRKQPDIAVGNVVGSNVFNILGILGLSSVVSPLHAPGVSTLDVVTMIVFTVLLIPLLYTGRLLHRLEGFVLLGSYCLYVVTRWPQ